MSSIVMVGHVEQRPIDQLLADAKNARTHSAAQVDQIAASIREFGFVNPILIGPDNRIIAGHARWRAARQVGMTEVPVIVLAHLSEAQRRALVIADNQLALNAAWDEGLLRTELAALAEDDFNLGLLGFDDEELVRLLAAQEAEGLTDPDACRLRPRCRSRCPAIFGCWGSIDCSVVMPSACKQCKPFWPAKGLTWFSRTRRTTSPTKARPQRNSRSKTMPSAAGFTSSCGRRAPT
jgi:hypothetical protein